MVGQVVGADLTSTALLCQLSHLGLCLLQLFDEKLKLVRSPAKSREQPSAIWELRPPLTHSDVLSS